jgi:ATP-dependent helicase HrpB
LGWQHKALLDDEVPARLTVPTGNALKVDYAPALDGGSPALAVRLQECFGWLDTPRVAKGRVPVVLQLLSPGYKPVQVTTDLRSFWQRGYVDVKKELKARYPKHSWPDDPLAAAPVAKGRSTRG